VIPTNGVVEEDAELVWVSKGTRNRCSLLDILLRLSFVTKEIFVLKLVEKNPSRLYVLPAKAEGDVDVAVAALSGDHGALDCCWTRFIDRRMNRFLFKASRSVHEKPHQYRCLSCRLVFRVRVFVNEQQSRHLLHYLTKTGRPR